MIAAWNSHMAVWRPQDGRKHGRMEILTWPRDGRQMAARMAAQMPETCPPTWPRDERKQKHTFYSHGRNNDRNYARKMAAKTGKAAR